MNIVRKNVKGYYGMNHEAAKELNLKDIPPKNTIYVEKGLKGHMLKRTIAHEKEEAYQMSHNHLKYNKAHKVAMKWEKNVR